MHDHESLKDERRAAARASGAGEASALDRQLALASLVGNRAVQRLLAAGSGLLRSGGRQVVHDEVAREIDARRGRGAELARSARGALERSLGHDFSDVRVHADAESAGLARALDAKAFTTGTDVFFASGAYDPGSSGGRELLAHELAHVVQQRGAPASGQLTVSDPGDASERQAREVAAGSTAAREVAEEEEPAEAAEVARQEEEEEEVQPG